LAGAADELRSSIPPGPTIHPRVQPSRTDGLLSRSTYGEPYRPRSDGGSGAVGMAPLIAAEKTGKSGARPMALPALLTYKSVGCPQRLFSKPDSTGEFRRVRDSSRKWGASEAEIWFRSCPGAVGVVADGSSDRGICWCVFLRPSYERVLRCPPRYSPPVG